MGFSDNLIDIRKEKNLSQEQLAELLNVSQQSISKWEQDSSYPEAEQLMQIAQKLDMSLDALLLGRQPKTALNIATPQNNTVFSGERRIVVQSHDGKILSAFYKFKIDTSKTKKEGRPKGVLYGIDQPQGPQGFLYGSDGNYSYMYSGGQYVVLGYYASQEDAQKELNEIHKAMQNGEASYQLKYHVMVKGTLIPKIIK